MRAMAVEPLFLAMIDPQMGRGGGGWYGVTITLRAEQIPAQEAWQYCLIEF